MSGSHVIAIDQGTTGTTVMVFDAVGRVRGRGYGEFTQHYPRPGWVEHDAEELWTTTLATVGEAIGDAEIAAAEIAAIGITNQRETAMLWDRETGRPLGRAIVWQDRRTAPLCESLRREGLETDWQARTGLVFDPYFSATKVRWMLDHLDGVGERAEQEHVAFGTIDSWLVWNLTGGRTHITDVTNASRTMLFNLHDLDWDDEILARLDIPRSILPRVVSSAGVCAETDPDVFFSERTPIAGIAGDQQAALFGQGCFADGQAKNTYGTGSFLLMHTGRSPVASRHRLLTTVAWRIGNEPPEYALEGAVFVTGAAVQWLRDGLKVIGSADESEALAAGLDGNDDVYFVPALTGLGAPWWDPHARGAIVGLTRGTTRAHLARAALEAICYQTRDVVEAMQLDSGIPLRELRADGGAVGNAFLMQFQADLLGVPVEIPDVSETTALGAAALAGLAIGLWDGRDELASRRRIARRYEPSLPPAERDRLHARWHDAVDRARGWSVPEYNDAAVSPSAGDDALREGNDR